MLTAVFKVVQDQTNEENFLPIENLDDVRKVFKICSRELKIWNNLYEL